MQTTTTNHTAPAEARTVTNPILKDEVTFLETSRESQGRHTLVEVKLAPGGGVDLHYHNDFAEEFICLAGELSMQLGDEVLRLSPGESATAPARVNHRFFNQSGQSCRFRCRIAPGFAGFEQSVQIAYGLVRAGKTTAQGIPKNPFALGYVVMVSGTYLPGWMAAVQPLMNWLGRQAIKRGIAAELQRRYMIVW